jgi:hypothetical protein
MSRTRIRKANQEAVMKAFGERVKKAAQLNLGATRSIRYNDGTIKRRRNVATGSLKDSVSFVTALSPHPALDFFFNVPYGTYLDEGVDGVKYRVPGNSRFSFRSKQPPTKFIREWMRVRRIKVRDPETNQFVRQTEEAKEGFALGIARKIKMRGIPKTEWFSQPFRDEFEKLPPDFLVALGKDVDEFLKEIKPF